MAFLYTAVASWLIGLNWLEAYDVFNAHTDVRYAHIHAIILEFNMGTKWRVKGSTNIAWVEERTFRSREEFNQWLKLYMPILPKKLYVQAFTRCKIETENWNCARSCIWHHAWRETEKGSSKIKHQSMASSARRVYWTNVTHYYFTAWRYIH